MDVDSGIFMLRRISRSKRVTLNSIRSLPLFRARTSIARLITNPGEQLPQQNLQFIYRSFYFLYMKESTKETIRSKGRIFRLNRKYRANMKEHSCFEIDSDKTNWPTQLITRVELTIIQTRSTHRSLPKERKGKDSFFSLSFDSFFVYWLSLLRFLTHSKYSASFHSLPPKKRCFSWKSVEKHFRHPWSWGLALSGRGGSCSRIEAKLSVKSTEEMTIRHSIPNQTTKEPLNLNTYTSLQTQKLNLRRIRTTTQEELDKAEWFSFPDQVELDLIEAAVQNTRKKTAMDEDNDHWKLAL
jgi:hypothetical protein